MVRRVLILGLLITSLLGYNEWQGNNSAFIFEMEGTLLAKAFTDPASVLHVLTVLPVLGQLFLVSAVIWKRTPKVLMVLGMVFVGLIVLLVAIGGLMQGNIRTIASVLPFFVFVAFTIRHLRKPMEIRAKRSKEKQDSA